VVFGRCGLLERSVPLDAVIVALAEHLRRLGATEAERMLGPDVEVLGPLLGVSDRSVTRAEPLLADRDVGPIALFAALTGVLARLCEGHETVLLLDDVHLAGPALAGWLNFLARRRLPVLVVATARPGEGEVLPATTTIMLGPLDAAATAELVGPERAGELHARSAGHPLLLTELAAASGEDLPASLIAAVSARCDELGAAAETVRSAAVLGPLLDVDLLAAVLHRPAINVLDDVELGTRRGLLVEQAGRFVFRHELVRAALAAGTTAPRRALLHREVGRALAGRPGVDPIEVAEHARLGGDLQLATRFLRAAATRAGERYDHATAAELLDRALELHPDPDTWLARARARTRLGDYPGALRDVERARAAGADAAEVGAWAAYFGRRFDDAVRYADDGAVAANDDSVRARCLMVGGRTRHARGDLADAETLLTRAVRVASGGDRVTASAWLGFCVPIKAGPTTR
jgi:tetratricopeptide (TPR) repeat protein